MKKAACILIALMMTFSLAAVAFAADVSASYSNGTLTVSTSTSGYWMIVVDGKGTERALMPSMMTLSFSYPLSDGEHRVRISNDVHGGANTVIYIKNGVSVDGYVAPTAAPTVKPAVTPTAKPGTTEEVTPAVTAEPTHTSHTPVVIPAVEATCTKDGLTEGTKCAAGGEILVAQQIVPALGHRYRVESATGNSVVYRCVRCDKKLTAGAKDAVANRFGNIVTGLDGAVLTYQAAADKNDGKIIVLKLDQAADAAVLTLESTLIPQIIREGYDRVEIVKGDFDAVVELNRISRSWFPVEGAISAYVFTLVKDGECKVEAQTATGLTAAETFDGVTVK